MSGMSGKIRLAVVALFLLAFATVASAGEPRVIGADEGDTGERPNGFKAVHKVGGISTGSEQVFVAVGTIPAGMSTGRHLHEIDEEILYVLEGEITAILGEQTMTAGAGETVFVPAGTWMELSNQSDATVRILLVIPRAEAETCFRLLHGIEVDDMTDAEKQAAFDLCKMKVPPPPTEPNE